MGGGLGYLWGLEPDYMGSNSNSILAIWITMGKALTTLFPYL